MRKLAPARVSYRDDLSISYRVYVMTDDYITFTGGGLGGGGGGGPPPPPPRDDLRFSNYKWKKNMRFIGVEVDHPLLKKILDPPLVYI